MSTGNKCILVVYHSQGGTMERLAHRFAQGAAREPAIAVILKKAGDATIDDLLGCDAIAIGSPEYFGTMAGMIKDFFDRTYGEAQEQTIGLPFVCFVCAGNDGRGAITQMERIIAGYKWRQALEHLRIVGPPTDEDYARVEELGQTLAAGLDLGIF
jgi:multimeric flavodoxin WrbA